MLSGPIVFGDAHPTKVPPSTLHWKIKLPKAEVNDVEENVNVGVVSAVVPVGPEAMVV